MTRPSVDRAPGPDTVRLWLVPDELPAPAVAGLLAVLDQDERARAAGYRSAVDRRRFVLAHGATRHIVAGCLGVVPAELRWRHGPHGKPELTGRHTGAEVNLSHSDDLALVAVSATRAVGVDIQRVLPERLATALAERHFPPEEVRFVRAATDPDRRAERFARLWARKEALVKAHGGRLTQGLRIPLLHTPTGAPTHPDDAWSLAYRVLDLPAPPGYRAAVALAGASTFRATLHHWPEPPT
ncbi:4'-phosphopantetheinyl transferase superfamily protein [Streptomyces sp. TLI_171]|uniref:4'-phosphopantetheinyl transferase family protein n=1 Tax=Streptomyces sp. TLI_171 TaxID=1938859 RepID=UPI000C1A50C2|nr:4'-phosphopantetheinyl transferase superfamily protein [Streptomyces sp. TLI_171]RKE23358.1 4'-phosphopantetheinyl transferase [Streptomyces sp. TLI_171]